MPQKRVGEKPPIVELLYQVSNKRFPAVNSDRLPISTSRNLVACCITSFPPSSCQPLGVGTVVNYYCRQLQHDFQSGTFEVYFRPASRIDGNWGAALIETERCIRGNCYEDPPPFSVMDDTEWWPGPSINLMASMLGWSCGLQPLSTYSRGLKASDFGYDRDSQLRESGSRHVNLARTAVFLTSFPLQSQRYSMWIGCGSRS